MAKAAYSWIMAGVKGGVRVVLLAIIERDALVQMGQGSGPFAAPQIARSQRVTSLQEKPRVLCPLRQGKKLLRQVLRFAFVQLTIPQAPQGGKKLRRFPNLLTQLVRAFIGPLDLGPRPALGSDQGRSQRDLQGEFLAG